METHKCEVCKKAFKGNQVYGHEVIRNSIQERIKAEAQNWCDASTICENCLNRFRVEHLQALIEEERGELTNLDEKVLESLSEHEIITQNLGRAFEQKATFGQKLSDGLASFGGSWVFLICFAGFLTIWIIYNLFSPKGENFDPYPFILLNLILSCLAAIQAPVIMMSQNRQEAKDRLRMEHDYQINLKAELEIRQLHMKIDQLLKHQWRRLLEIQQLQFELMSENKQPIKK